MGTSSQTEKVTLPPPTPEEERLISVMVQLAEAQIEQIVMTENIRDIQVQEFEGIVEAEASQGLIQQREQAAGETLDFLSQLQRDLFEGGFIASPEQQAQIEKAADAALAAGESDIARFAQRQQQQVVNEVGPGLGLRPSDTPIVNRLGGIAEEAVREQGDLVQKIRGRQAELNLELPFLTSDLALRNQEFQESLRNRAFLNRIDLTGGVGGTFGNVLGFNTIGAQQVAQQPRLAQTTTKTQTSQSFLGGVTDIIGAVGGAAAGGASLFKALTAGDDKKGGFKTGTGISGFTTGAGGSVATSGGGFGGIGGGGGGSIGLSGFGGK